MLIFAVFKKNLGFVPEYQYRILIIICYSGQIMHGYSSIQLAAVSYSFQT